MDGRKTTKSVQKHHRLDAQTCIHVGLLSRPTEANTKQNLNGVMRKVDLQI